ncbi:MAG: pilus assembly protein CpaE [Paraglaciecola sp.]|jgi:pilus assembly protein CpaE
MTVLRFLDKEYYMNIPSSSNIVGFGENHALVHKAESARQTLPYPLSMLVVCGDAHAQQDLALHLGSVSSLEVEYSNSLPNDLSHFNLVILILNDHYSMVKFDIERLAKYGTGFILLGDNISNDLIRLAIHFKVKDIISMHELELELPNALIKSANELMNASQIAPAITVINGKSGSGASFITSCLGEISANLCTQEIAILDADLHYGTLADTFSLDAEYYLTDALRELDKLDNTAIKSMMMKRNNLSLLASKPYTLLNSDNDMLSHLEQLVWKIKLNYDLVLVDLSRGLESYAIPLLNLSSKILVVVQQNIVSLREAKVLIQQLTTHLGIPTDRFHIIVNRYSSKASCITLDDVKKVLGIESLYSVSNDYQLANAGLDSGSPLLKVANNKVIHSEIEHIIKDLFPIEVASQKSPSLLTKIFGRA